MILDYFILIIYLGGLLYIGIRTKRSTLDITDFALAGRSLTFSVFFGTLFTTIIGGYCTVGLTAYAYREGISGWVMGEIPFALVGLYIGRFIAGKLRKTADISTGDLFERYYGIAGRIIVAILSLFYCIGILATQVNAIGIIGETYFNVDRTLISIISGITIILYSVLGAFRAVVLTDLVQITIIMIGLPLSVFFGMEKIGLDNFIANVPQRFFQPFASKNLLSVLALMLSYGLGEQLVPAHTQRYYAAIDPATSRRGTQATFLFYIVAMFLVTILGMMAYITIPDLETPEMALPYVVTAILPPGLSGIMMVAVIAAIMSTADSFLIAGSTIFIRDISQRFLFRNREIKYFSVFGGTVTAVLGFGALFFAFLVPKILDNLNYSYSLWVSTIVAPLIIAAVWKIRSPFAGISSIIAGLLTSLFWTLVLHEPLGISGSLPGLTANLTVFLLVLLLRKIRIRD